MRASSGTRGQSTRCTFPHEPNAAPSFKNMSDKEWDQIMEVHLKGAYACTKATWPIFRKQKFGRIVNTASAAGLYGASSSREPAHVWELTGVLPCRELRAGKLQCGEDGPRYLHEDPCARGCEV